ncbi:hypothetical protein FHS88_000220 [Roseomonas alkaliterrae]|uniref:Uncharacterized protein n=3 Tax=Neoroseomonas alkaliterrae TaxID=1452450 RepID=A0A840XN01_9PROT|nr:DUF6384 family protein [Neoroseomonas alkaliterrae]MBB5688110.1 hypothetical protein [Neoroseomonas alkaliterrae]
MPEARAGAPALDETMLAMDVVDTIRHADRLVERELAGTERQARLRQRLREIYASQGIEVADHVLDAGIAALEEKRFAYTPKGEGWRRSLATAWATRGRWGKFALIGLGVVVLGWGVHFATVTLPAQREAAAIARELQHDLPRALRAEHDRVLAGTQEAGPRAEAARLLAEGEAAARAGNAAEARARRAALADLATRLAQEYTVRIVNRPGEPSAVWRVPAANPRARNYYLVVEAVDRTGRPVEVQVTSEEDGRTARVSRWGLRVPEAEFERVRRDKLADGIIDQPEIGRKRAGTLDTEWTVDTTGRAILSW